MPPASSQKGTGKKGAGAIARQRSRNTTPSSVPLVTASLPPIDTKQTEYLDLNYETFRNITYEDVVDQNASSSHMPESKSLDGIMTRFQRLQDTLEKRSTFCDRGMRLLVSALRARMDEAAAERSREEERQRIEDDERARKANKANKKKRKAADSLAPQDGNTGQCMLHIIDIQTSDGRTFHAQFFGMLVVPTVLRKCRSSAGDIFVWAHSLVATDITRISAKPTLNYHN